MSHKLNPRWRSLLVAALLAIAAGRGALADDSEIFTGTSSAGAQPNPARSREP